ncbi:MAG: GntR family transcriptional regulator [Coriobacteriia bacterium]|nr:GntR family transcriptional regulator [Coriobacteriia bacterium]
MRIDFESIKPLYLQIAEAIEDDILTGRLQEGGPAYSQLILSNELGVNPATAAKGITVLVQAGILEKKRGLSMAVATGARAKLISSKQKNSLQPLVRDLVAEARKIELSEEDVVKMLQDGFAAQEGGAAHE